MSESPALFDRETVRRRRNRAAASLHNATFLLERAQDAFEERLDDVNRQFKHIAVIGAWDGSLTALLAAKYKPETLVQLDFSPGMAALAAQRCPAAETVVGDEEALPLPLEKFDLIVAPLTLHAVNDLPGALIQMRRALLPDGLLIAAMMGGETLKELRDSIGRAEIDTLGGISPRVSPMAELRDLGGLLQRAGFALPVADREQLTVRYANPLSLMQDLRAMGETNYLGERRRVALRRETLARTLEILSTDHSDPDGKIRTTFEIAYLHGWAPAPDQPKPLRPGSAKMRLADALGTREEPLSSDTEH